MILGRLPVEVVLRRQLIVIALAEPTRSACAQ
jgi:hypothetical protein